MATAGSGSKFLRSTLQPLAADGVVITETPVDVGVFGTVVEGRWMGAQCAIKRLRTEDATEYLSDRFLYECTLWSELKHPNVLQFYGVYFPLGGGYPVIVTELLQHNLDRYLSTLRREAFPLITKAYILRDVTLAVRYLHSRKPAIILRDLSASFIYLTPGLTAKLGEFGTASKLENDGRGYPNGDQGTLPVTGSCRWPEPYSSFASDAFSFGDLILHVLLHTFPEPGPKIRKAGNDKGEVVRELQRRDQYLKQLTNKEKNFQPILAQCFNDDPKGRPAFAHLYASLELVINHLNGGTRAHVRGNAKDVLQLQAQLRNKEEELRSSRLALTRMQMSVSSILSGQEPPEPQATPPLPKRYSRPNSAEHHRSSRLSLKDEGYLTMCTRSGVRTSTGSEDSDFDERPASNLSSRSKTGKPKGRSRSAHQHCATSTAPGIRNIDSPESYSGNGMMKHAPTSPDFAHSVLFNDAPVSPPTRREAAISKRHSVIDISPDSRPMFVDDVTKSPPFALTLQPHSSPVSPMSPFHSSPRSRQESRTSPSSSDAGSPPAGSPHGPSKSQEGSFMYALMKKDHKSLQRGEKVVIYPGAWDSNCDSCVVQTEQKDKCEHVHPASKYLEVLRPIKEEVWFTQMGREEVEKHMRKAINPEGSFLVREGRNGYVLAVKHSGKPCSYQIFCNADQTYSMNQDGMPNFVTISELVREYTRTRMGLVTLLTVPYISMRMELPRESFSMDEEIHTGKRFALWSGKFAASQGAPATPVAVKTIPIDEDRHKSNTAALYNESSILNLISRMGGHANILSMFGVCVWSEQPHLIVELCYNLNLQQIMSQHADLYMSEHLVHFASQIASAMAYLEEKGIVHRQLKAANVLVTNDAECKLSGFHCALTAAKAEENLVVKEYNLIANPRWTAPEVYTGEAHYTSKADVWSFGMLLIELFTHGLEPYHYVSLADVKTMLAHGTPPDIPRNCPLSIQSHIESCLRKIQSERPSFSALKEKLLVA